MWVFLAFISAFFLGFYDVAKKQSLKDNAVLSVLFLNTIFCTAIFLPFIIISNINPQLLKGTFFDAGLNIGFKSLEYISPIKAHIAVIIKSCIVLSSWIMGYFALKHLPLTLAGPINATRPVLVLVGAIFLFNEKLNIIQWSGVAVALFSLFLLSLSGKKEGIDFKSNKWIYCLFGAVIMGAVSGLYDKFIMKFLPPMFVQSWFNVYQVFIMGILVLLMRKHGGKLKWRWSIPLISLFVSIADFAYFYCLSNPDALIAVVSMVRRGSVIVSFTAGVLLFKDKNIKSKAIDLVFVLLGLILLCWGSLV